MGTSGRFNSGVKSLPNSSINSMLSAWVIKVPQERGLLTTGDCSGRRNASKDFAFGLLRSGRAQRVLNSVNVMSDVQQVAPARWVSLAGRNGAEHFAASGVCRMLVVVARSHCECRQTNSRSLVKVTSHSMTPAPCSAAAMYPSRLCSG